MAGDKSIANLMVYIGMDSKKADIGIIRAKKSFSSLMSDALKMGLGIASLGGAFETMKGVVNSTGNATDTYERTVAATTASVNTFFRAIAGGDFTNIIDGMAKAAEAGAAFADAMDRTQERQRSLDVNKAETDPYLKSLEAKFRDKDKGKISPKERLAALEEYKTIKEKLVKDQVDSDQYALKKFLENINGFSKLSAKEALEYMRRLNDMQAFVDKKEKLDAKAGEIKSLVKSRRNSGLPAFNEQTKNLETEYASMFNALTADEKNFFDIINKAGQTSDKTLDQLKDSLIKVATSQADYNDVQVQNIRVKNQIVNEINKEIEAQGKLNDLKAKELKTVNNLNELKNIKNSLNGSIANSLLDTGVTPYPTQSSGIPHPKDNEWLGNFTYGMDEAQSKYNNFVDNMNSMTNEFLTDSIATIAEGLGEALAGGNMDGFFQSILQGFGSFVSSMGKMIIAYGMGMEAFKKAFATPAAAIIAGATLVAIGGAIKSASSRGPSVGGGGGGYSGGGLGYSVGNSSNMNSSRQVELVWRRAGRDLVAIYDETKFSINGITGKR